MDNDVQNIIKDGATSHRLLKAAKIVRDKENSPLIKLPLNLNNFSADDFDCASIDDLPRIVEIACSSGSLEMTLDCIKVAYMEDIMLKVQGPFSLLLSLVGSNQLFKWLRQYSNEVKQALESITDGLADYIIEAINKGAHIISLADPSGMVELLGEKSYKEYVVTYIIKLLKKIEPHLENSLVHICPLLSLNLENYGLLTLETIWYERNNYAQTLIELSQYESIKFVGHRCVNAETNKDHTVYILNIHGGDILC